MTSIALVNPRSIDAVVLVGGRGTRLASVVTSVPKSLAGVSGRPFLDHLLAVIVRAQSVRRIVLAAGHLGEEVASYASKLSLPVPVEVLSEPTPLGTGGAIRSALPKVVGNDFLAMNGDAIGDWPFDALVAHHRQSSAVATLIAALVPDRGRYGQITTKNGRVNGFEEKKLMSGPGFINGGAYCFARTAVAEWPEGLLSLEREVLPILAQNGLLDYLEYRGSFIDIGTPESFADAQRVVGKISGL